MECCGPSRSRRRFPLLSLITHDTEHLLPVRTDGCLDVLIASSGMKTEQFTFAIERYIAQAVAELPVDAMQY